MKKNTIATASLADYAAVINDEHRAAFGCAQQAIEHARVAGEHLLKAKAALKHGEWLPWLAANVEVTERQAQRYMKVAENWTAIAAKYDAASYLTIDGALKELAKPKPAAPKYDAASDLPTVSEPKSAEPADLPAADTKPPKAVKPAEVEKIQAELESANDTIKELVSQQEPLQEEVEFLRKMDGAGDKEKAAAAEVVKLQAQVRVLNERVRGLMNEKNEAVRAAKMWQRKYETLAKQVTA